MNERKTTLQECLDRLSRYDYLYQQFDNEEHQKKFDTYIREYEQFDEKTLDEAIKTIDGVIMAIENDPIELKEALTEYFAIKCLRDR